MAENETTFIIRALDKTREGQEGIKRLQTTLDQFNERAKKIAKMSKALQQNFSNIGSEFSKLTYKTPKLSGNIKILGQTNERLQKYFSELGLELIPTKKAVSDVKYTFDGLSNTMNENIKLNYEIYNSLANPIKGLKAVQGTMTFTEQASKGFQTTLNSFAVTTSSVERALQDHLKVPLYNIRAGMKQVGVTGADLVNQTKISGSVFMDYSNVTTNLANKFDTFGKVMAMDRDLFISFIKRGYKFPSTGARIATQIRLLTHGLHGFKMELLSTMFFGMQMQQLGMSMLRPAMKMFGITELFSNVLAVVMLPIMKLIFPYLLGFAKWLMDLGPLGKTIIGFGALFLVAAGGIIYFGSQLGLFIGAVPKIFAAVSIVRKGAIDMVKALISGGRKMIIYAKGLWPRLAGIFGKGMSLLSSRIRTKGVGLTTSFAKTGTKLAKTSRMTGMAMGTGLLGPIGIALTGIIIAVTIFAAAWSKNWFGIRQKTGAFVVWFSEVYDKWIKPVLFHMGTGIIILKNMFIFGLTNIKNIWSFVWLSIQSIAFRTWNALLTGVETFVNGILLPFRVLYKIGGGIAEKIFGFKLPEFPEFDLSAFKASTTEVDNELATVKENLKSAFTDTAVKTVKDVEWLNGALSGLTQTMKVAGEGMIESGNKMDAERKAKQNNAESTNMLSGIISNFTSMITGTFTPAVNESTDSISTNTKAIIDSGNEALNTMPKIDDLNLSISDTNTKTKEVTNTLNNKFKPALENQQEILGDVQTAFSNTTSKVNEYIDALNRIPRDVYTTIHKEYVITERRRGLFGLGGLFGIFQHGGIVMRPTLGLLAEKGPEAVIPLNRAGGTTPTLGNITIHNTYNISGVSSPDDVEAKIEEANAKLIDDLKAMIR